MDVITAARELGKAIQQNPTYTAIRIAQENNDKDTALQQAIAAFNDKRDMLSDEVEKENKDEAIVQKLDTELKTMYQDIFKNENMRTFSDAREAMEHLLGQINTIISGSAAGEDPDAIDLEAGCGGGCSSCSGCH